MPLAAAQVIDALAERITGLSLAGDRVLTSRTWPLAEKDLPAWRVIAVDEDVEPTTVHKPSLNLHHLQVELRGFASASEDLDDVLHAMASQALTAVFNTPVVADALAGMVRKVSLSLRRIERAMKTEGEASLGLVTITIRAEFHTPSNDPDTIR